jgi:hypothetical protein
MTTDDVRVRPEMRPDTKDADGHVDVMSRAGDPSGRRPAMDVGLQRATVTDKSVGLRPTHGVSEAPAGS